MSAPRVRWIIGALLVMACGALPVAAAGPVEPTAGYTDVQRAFLREDFEQATSLAQAFLLQYPEASEAPRVWLWLALSLDRLQRSNEALVELDRLKRRLESRNPLWPEMLFWEGEVSRRSLQMIRAKLAYERLLERYPGSSWASQAQLGIGILYLHQQAFGSAIPYFREAAARYAGTPAALDARLYAGLCHLQLKQFTDAVAVLEPLLNDLKDREVIAQAALYLGESFSGLRRFDDAVRAYRRAIQTSESKQWRRLAQFGLGWALYQTGQCAESVDAFEPYLSQTPSASPSSSQAGPGDHRIEALFAQGGCLMQLGREADALSRFERLLSEGRDHPLVLEAGLAMANAYRREDRIAKAKELLHELLRRLPDATARARVQLQLGTLALEQGIPAQAKTVFELATESEEASIRQAALSGLGDVQVFLGHLDAAQRFYEKAVRASESTPLAAYATYQLGRLRLQLGALNEAMSLFQRLTSNADPALADDAKLAMALTYVRQGEEQVARSTLEAIRQQRPTALTAARAAYYLALLELGKGDEALAQRLCEETIAKAPKTEEAIDARLILADLLATRTSAEDARRWLRQLYESSALPRSHRAKLAKHLGDLARGEQAYPEAIEWYDTAMQLLPALSGEAMYRIASCYEEAGDFAAAKSWYRRIDQPPWRVRGLLAEAKLLEREDHREEARAVYGLLADESIPEAKVAQERLAALGDKIMNKEPRW